MWCLSVHLSQPLRTDSANRCGALLTVGKYLGAKHAVGKRDGEGVVQLTNTSEHKIIVDPKNILH